MVKIKAFQAYTYQSQDYDTLLKFNHQSLSKLKESSRAYIARTSTIQQINNGVLVSDQIPTLYIYNQIFLQKSAFGVIVEASIQDYLAGKIKVHEKTLCRQGYGYESYRKEHVGPIVLSYRKQESVNIKKLLLKITSNLNQYSKWNTMDGRSHRLWKIQSEQIINQITQSFLSISNLYVLDGHHRLKAAVQNYKFEEEKLDKSERFLSLIYPPEEVSIHPFHRIINQVPQKFNVLNFLQENSIKYTVLEQASNEDLEKFEIIFKNNQGFFGINFKDQNSNCIEKLSVQKLKCNILDPVYEDQIAEHLDFIPGIHQWQDLVTKNKSIFLVRSITIDEIFTIADENQIMPPKSTWFEPKPCNKMVVRLPY